MLSYTATFIDTIYSHRFTSPWLKTHHQFGLHSTCLIHTQLHNERHCMCGQPFLQELDTQEGVQHEGWRMYFLFFPLTRSVLSRECIQRWLADGIFVAEWGFVYILGICLRTC
jgi:hypothetical protein